MPIEYVVLPEVLLPLYPNGDDPVQWLRLTNVCVRRATSLTPEEEAEESGYWQNYDDGYGASRYVEDE